MIRRLASSNIALVLLAGALLTCGMALSIINRDFNWLSRFGALIISVGIVLLARPAIVRKDIKIHVGMADTGLSHLDPEHWRKSGEPIPEYVHEDARSRLAVGVLGPIVCLVGTVTNGFATLLNGFLNAL